MQLWEILILAIVQGLTEFLPVSSSGHLVVANAVLEALGGESVDDLVEVNIALHLGTLLSVLVFYRKEIARLFSKDGQVDCLVAIELIAQSAAIPLIGKQTPDTAPMAGMLIQIKNYSITQRSIPINSTLSTRVTVEVQPDSVFVMANGQVSFNNTVICEGSVTLAVQQ